MLLDKYAPKSTKELVGNAPQIAEIKKFLTGWAKGKALLVHGTVGSGKSAAIRLACQELGHEVVEIHANENRQLDAYYQASAQRGIFSKKKAFLFEDIETMPMRGFAELINNSEHPVICTIGDAYQLSPAVRKSFKLLKFEKPAEAELMKFLDGVCRKEKIACERQQLEQLARAANGDVRGLLIDLEILRLEKQNTASPSAYIGYRDSEQSIFNTLKIIFKTMSLENSRMAVDSCEKEPEELVAWLEENIAEEYADPRTIAVAFDYLSRADIFSSRIIRRQSWSLQKYLALAAYGTTLAKNRPSIRFASYKYPAFARRNDAALGKIAKILHISRRRASAYIPVLRMLARKNSAILDELGLDEKEAAMILGAG